MLCPRNMLLSKLTTTAGNADGFWKIVFPETKGSLTNYNFTFSSAAPASSVITLHNVVFGDVVFCSGQSNMVLASTAINSLIVLGLYYYKYSQEFRIPYLYLYLICLSFIPTTSTCTLEGIYCK